jgi:endonuclease YncB( thermonuclease family)
VDAPYGGPWHAEIVRVIDGDTYEVRVRLPLFTDRRVEVRLHNVSAPEKSTDAGKASMNYVKTFLTPGRAIDVRTYLIAKTGDEEMTFIRYVADVFLDGKDFGQQMVAAGFAKVGAFEG